MEDFLYRLLLEDDDCDKRVETEEEKDELEDFQGYDCTYDSVEENYCCKKIKKNGSDDPNKGKKDDPNKGKKDDPNKGKKDDPNQGKTNDPQDDSGGNTGVVDRNETPDRSKELRRDLDCTPWEDYNIFDEKFPGNESKKAKEFQDWLFNYIPPGNKSKFFQNFASSYLREYNACGKTTKEYEEEGILHRSPFIRGMAQWDTRDSKGELIDIFDMWYQNSKQGTTSSQVNKQQTQVTTTTQANKENKPMEPGITSKNFPTFQKYFEELKKSESYEFGDFRTAVDELESLVNRAAVTVPQEKFGKKDIGCEGLILKYIDVANNRPDYMLGNPSTNSGPNDTEYQSRDDYWFDFLEALISVKKKILACRKSNKTTPELSQTLTNLQPGNDSPWAVNMEDLQAPINNLTLFTSKITIESVIKRKLEQKLEEKLIKESIRKKLLLKSDLKESKVGKISENLYKIAGEFYNGDKKRFIKKLDKLTEAYKKSKMYLTEGSSDSFSVAFDRVFKGDEEEIKAESISYFLDKLGLEGAIRASVKEELEKIPSDEITKMFTDDWSDIVVKAIVKNAESDDSAPENVMGAIQKVVASQIEMSSETQKRLEKEISKLLTPVRDSKIDRIKSLADEIKRKIIDSES